MRRQNTPDMHEEAITRALRSLRDEPVPAGLEQRVRHHFASQPSRSRRSALCMRTGALSAATAALLVLVAVHNRHAPTQQAHARSAPASSPQVYVASDAHTHANVPELTVTAAVVHPTQTLPARTPVLGVTGIRTEVDPAFLPSMPAPVQPLTPEERTLARMARHERGLLMATLDIPEPHPASHLPMRSFPPLLAGFTPEHGGPVPATASDLPTIVPERNQTNEPNESAEPQ